jgi:hypothetical protein
MLLQSPKVRFQQPKYPLGIPCADARRPQPDYQPFLPVHHAACFGDVLLNTAKVIFEAHSNPRNHVGIGGPFGPIDA